MSPIIIALLAGLASVFNFHIGNGGLRVSLGIIVLIIALYKYEKLNVLKTSLLSGIAVFVVRIILDYAGTGSVDETVLYHALEIIFYLVYGFLFDLMVRKDTSVYKSPLILVLMLCDFGANAAEYLARFLFLQSAIVPVDFQTVFLAAFIRSAVIWVIIHFVFKLDESKHAFTK
ncbi:MAG: hypothetical protein GX985_03805 [Gallicola sp.]|nr:hypothetical protein [Gallicola sp.]